MDFISESLNQEVFELVPIESHNNSTPTSSLTSYKILNRKDFERNSTYPIEFLLKIVVRDVAGHNETALIIGHVIKVNKNLPEIDW